MIWKSQRKIWQLTNMPVFLYPLTSKKTQADDTNQNPAAMSVDDISDGIGTSSE